MESLFLFYIIFNGLVTLILLFQNVLLIKHKAKRENELIDKLVQSMGWNKIFLDNIKTEPKVNVKQKSDEKDVLVDDVYGEYTTEDRGQ